VFLRTNLTLRPAEDHAITLSLTSELDLRDTEKATVGTSTLTGRGTRVMFVGGAEYQYSLTELFTNSVFGKVYSQRVTAEDYALGDIITREVQATTFGVGDSLRLDLSENIYLKASY